MKKIITLFICAVFTISTFAQEKKEPTKKETFDFIVYMIGESNGTRCESHDITITKSEVLDYDYQQMTIDVKSTVYKKGNCSNTTTFNLDLNSIKSIDSPELFEQCDKDYRLYIKFSKLINTSSYFGDSCKETRRDTQDFFPIIFNDSSKAIKFKKSIEHLKRLNGGVNTSLFDD